MATVPLLNLCRHCCRLSTDCCKSPIAGTTTPTIRSWRTCTHRTTTRGRAASAASCRASTLTTSSATRCEQVLVLPATALPAAVQQRHQVVSHASDDWRCDPDTSSMCAQQMCCGLRLQGVTATHQHLVLQTEPPHATRPYIRSYARLFIQKPGNLCRSTHR